MLNLPLAYINPAGSIGFLLLFVMLVAGLVLAAFAKFQNKPITHSTWFLIVAPIVGYAATFAVSFGIELNEDRNEQAALAALDEFSALLDVDLKFPGANHSACTEAAAHVDYDVIGAPESAAEWTLADNELGLTQVEGELEDLGWRVRREFSNEVIATNGDIAVRLSFPTPVDPEESFTSVRNGMMNIRAWDDHTCRAAGWDI